MNYAQLTTAVSNTVENSFSADEMARFTRLTEQKIYEFVRLPAQVETFTGNLTAGNRFFAVPSGYRSTLSLMVLNGQDAEFLLQKDVSYIRSAYPGSNVTGLPKVYAQQDETQIVVGPTPASAYPVEWQYEAFPESIVTAGTTWLGDNFDSVLFNGMLVEAARYLRLEAETVAQYEKMFQESMIQLQKLGVAKLRMDIYRGGQARAAKE
jgi:hypothetical protein